MKFGSKDFWRIATSLRRLRLLNSGMEDIEAPARRTISLTLRSRLFDAAPRHVIVSMHAESGRLDDPANTVHVHDERNFAPHDDAAHLRYRLVSAGGVERLPEVDPAPDFETMKLYETRIGGDGHAYTLIRINDNEVVARRSTSKLVAVACKMNKAEFAAGYWEPVRYMPYRVIEKNMTDAEV